MFETLRPTPLDNGVKAMLALWSVLLIPWEPMLTVAGTSSQVAPAIVADILICSVVSYPILLGISFVYRREKPHLVWLPALTLLGIFASGLLSELVEAWQYFSN